MANKETWEIYTQLTPTHKRIGIYNIKTKEKIQLGIIDRNMELPSTLLAIAKQQAKEHNGQLKEETSTPTSALTEGRSKRPKKMEGSHTSSVEKKD